MVRNIYHIDDIGKLCFLWLSSSLFPLCCASRRTQVGQQCQCLRLRLQPTADLDSQTEILTCSADTLVLEMTDIAPGVGSRDESGEGRSRPSGGRKLPRSVDVDLSLDGVEPESTWER